MGFVRFPRTPHLAWLSAGVPRDDKLLSPSEMRALLSNEVVVEEKLDGANLGISIDDDGELRLQNRGQYLIPPFHGQFARATSWLDHHRYELTAALGEGLILFGEWCAARHSIAYDRLPDWFAAFDIYDRQAERFWSTGRRDAWAERLGIQIVPLIFRGRTALVNLKEMVFTETSRFGAPNLEGVVVRREGREFLEARAKLVCPDFVQSIEEHWRGRPIEWNAISLSQPKDAGSE
jgi:ATP-dependent RNA circularization protein (DNA/RNA ligase family)